MTNNEQQSNTIESVLNAGTETLDASILNKLRQARQKALDQESGRSISWWIPAGAVTATVAVAMFAFWLGVVSPQTRVNTLEDLELLASADTTELYEQIEFYEWLESQEQRNKIDAG